MYKKKNVPLINIIIGTTLIKKISIHNIKIISLKQN